jgi:hypothetical protein
MVGKPVHVTRNSSNPNPKLWIAYRRSTRLYGLKFDSSRVAMSGMVVPWPLWPWRMGSY